MVSKLSQKLSLLCKNHREGLHWSAIKLRYRADDDGDGDDNDDNNDDHFDWVQQLAIKLQYRSEDERLCDNLTLLSPNTWLRRTIRGQPGQLESCEVRLGLGFADIMRHFCQSGVPLGVIWHT